jgi:tetratricopeptide (TPR) repeat protein
LARFAKAQVLCYLDPAAAEEALGSRPTGADMWRELWLYQNGVARMMLRDYDAARELLEEALSLPVTSLWARAWSYVTLAMNNVFMGNATDAVVAAERAAASIDPAALWIQDVLVNSILALARAHAGDLAGARIALNVALDLAERSYPHVAKAAGLPIIVAAGILEASGDLEAALEVYEDVVLHGLHTRAEIVFHYVGRARSRLHKQLGQTAVALDVPQRSEAELVAIAHSVGAQT